MYRNAAVRCGKLSSEAVGLHTGVAPAFRPRPASQTTINLRNPAIRDGKLSSDPIGLHTGVVPQRPRQRPNTAPIWRTGGRTSDDIGTHPAAPRVDPSNRTAMHYEAQFSRRFGEVGQLGAVLKSGSTEAAVQFQKEWLKQAHSMAPKDKEDTTATDNTTVRAEGQRMEKMAFDSVYSNRHVTKDTESAFGPGLIPMYDPRLSAVRPKALPYGVEHRVATAHGNRPVLPTRSFMQIGEGPGRSIDF